MSWRPGGWSSRDRPKNCCPTKTYNEPIWGGAPRGTPESRRWTDVLGARQGVHGPGGARAAPVRTAPVDAEPHLFPRPLLPEEVRRPGNPTGGDRLPGRIIPPPVHREGGSPGKLPVRSLRRPAPRGGPDPRLLRDDGSVDGRGIHPQRHPDLEQPHGPGPHDGRGT